MELIWDRSSLTLDWEGLNIVAAPEAHPPFPCQVSVEEQDTFLVLGESTYVEAPDKPAWYLAYQLERIKPRQPGSVVISGKQPNRFMAVVIDVDQTPICRPIWVLPAYNEIMHAVEKRKVTSIALPLLGTGHGKLTEKESIECLRDVLQVSRPDSLMDIWLMLPPDTDYSCINHLLPQKR